MKRTPPRRVVDVGLVALAARRTAPWIVWALVFALIVLVVASGSSHANLGGVLDATGSSSLETPLDATVGSASSATSGSLSIHTSGNVGADVARDTAVSAGLARQSLWFVFLLVAAPAIVLRATSSAAPWRRGSNSAEPHGRATSDERGDAAWLAPRAVSNATMVLSTWLGCWLAGCAVLVACACAAEWRAGDAPSLGRSAGSLDGPGRRWVVADGPVTWRAHVPDGASANSTTRARVELGLGAGAGGAGLVEITARGANASTRATTRVGNRGWIEVALPARESEIEFQLACGGEARVCVLSDRVELWTDAPRFAAGTAMMLRLSVSLAAWIALALALACWMHPATAAVGVLALLAPAWFAGDVAHGEGPIALARFLPGADVFEALDVVGDGRAPATWVAPEAIGAFVLIVVSLVAAWRGARAWRAGR